MSDGKIEWRLVCARHGLDAYHRTHVYAASERTTKTAETRAELLHDRNTDPVTQTYAQRGCVPWRHESRYVGPWTTFVDDPAEVLAWWAEAFGSRSGEVERGDAQEALF